MSKAAVTDQGVAVKQDSADTDQKSSDHRLLVLAIASTVLSKDLLSPANLHNMLRQYASIGIMAVGQTIVILLAGVDLSQGAMIALVSMVVAYLNVNGYGLIIPSLPAWALVPWAVCSAEPLLPKPKYLPSSPLWRWRT